MKTHNTFFSVSSHTMLTTALVLVLTMFLFLASNRINAQVYFNEGILNPFGLNLTPSADDLVFHALADIDNDGDLDDFVSHRQFVQPCWVVSAFDFYENQGTSECPEYVKIPNETFGLPALTAAITFADTDNDGDLDAYTSNHCFQATFSFHRNTGTATQPQFNSTPDVTSIPNWNIGFAMVAFGDLDGDGDYDALVNGLRPAVFKYLENTGTPSSPLFGNPVDNPFGLSIPSFNSSEWSQFVDWDCDGDLDILNGHWQMGNTHKDWLLYIHENNGTPTAPSFLPAVSTGHLIMPNAMGDMDGDGDLDVFSDEYFYKNLSTNGCVTLPTAGFSMIKNGLTLEFVNESTGQATDCRPVQYLWSFGDGSFSQEASPSHTYATENMYNVCLIVEDIAGQSTHCQQALVSNAGELESGNGITVFPNPSSGVIQIRGLQSQTVLLKVTDVFGRMVLEQEITGDGSIDLSNLVKGRYFVVISGRMTKNVILQ